MKDSYLFSRIKFYDCLIPIPFLLIFPVNYQVQAQITGTKIKNIYGKGDYYSFTNVINNLNILTADAGRLTYLRFPRLLLTNLIVNIFQIKKLTGNFQLIIRSNK